MNNQPREFSKLLTKITPEIAIFGENRLQLSKLKKQDEQMCVDMLEFVLDWAANLLGKVDNFTQMLVPELAQQIMTEYWFMSFDEICYVIRKGVLGKYKMDKQFTNPFDLPTVISWFECYDTERESVVTNHQIQKAKIHKQEMNLVDISLEYTELNNLFKEGAKQAKEKQIKETSKSEEYRKFKIDYLNGKIHS